MNTMNIGFDANQLARLATSPASSIRLRQGLVVGIFPATNPDDDYDVSLIEVEVGVGTMKVPYLDSYYPEIEDYVLLLSFEDQVFAVGSIAWGASGGGINTGSGTNTGGGSGSGGTYTHEQQVAASTWTITHNLGFDPSVTVVDSAGTTVIGELTYLPEHTTVVVEFTAPFAGKAYCS